MRSSSKPAVFKMSSDWSSMTSSPFKPGAASKTIQATSEEREAIRGAMIPPSLWPMRPILFESISFCDAVVVEARRLQNELRLEQHDVFALQAGGREQDHPSDVRGTRGNQGSNDSAFAVADEADPLRVNFLLRFQVRERRGCIAREI